MLKQQGRVGVPEVVEPQAGEAGSISDPQPGPAQICRVQRCSQGVGEDQAPILVGRTCSQALLQLPQPVLAQSLRSTLLHQSGQWISGTMVVPLPARTPQGYGSALTYARRYGLAAMIGLSVDRDDDGTAGSQPPLPQPGARATASGGDQHHSITASAKPVVAWWQVPCNQANADQFRAFARAYAKAKGVKTVGWEDIRCDFAIEGRLVDYFGATPLGQIVERVRRDKRGAEPAGSLKPALGESPPPDSKAA